MKTLETDRLTLRQWLPSDLAPYAAINQDPRVMEFLLKPLTIEETAARIAKIEAHFKKHGCGLFACVLKESNELIGSIGLNVPDFEAPFTPCFEIGWRFAYHAWGKGYCREAARAVLKDGFERLLLREILSFTVPANIRSIRVMEKIGMERDPYGDFFHPKVPIEHPLSLHVLYRMSKQRYENIKNEQVP